MRISDWSSDVCSSDLWLLPAQMRRTQRALACRLGEGPAAVAPALVGRAVRHRDDLLAQGPGDGGGLARRDRSEERRVGKSGSVRVDLGGRRIIKKKTT